MASLKVRPDRLVHAAGDQCTRVAVDPGFTVLDAAKVGEILMDITPGLPRTDNFQHWPSRRPLVLDTAHRVLDYTGGLW